MNKHCNLCQKETISKCSSTFELIENRIYECHEGLSLFQCPVCRQLYLNVYVEVYDDSWMFYVPVSKEESLAIGNNMNEAQKLVNSRKHITWSPNSDFMEWKEGSELALFCPLGW